MKSIQQWLDEYGESHQDHTNKLIHWICVPSIFFSIIAMLYAVKMPWAIGGYSVNLAVFILVVAILYYASLSRTLWIGMLLFALVCLGICQLLEQSNTLPTWLYGIIIFVLAWIGQFYGHKVEGQKPSFFKDIQFLLIGPAWLMSFVYRKLGLKL